MITRKRVERAQNFIRNTGLIADLVSNSSINSHDTLLEIGAGSGTITTELLQKAEKVIAFETDPNLCKKLEERFVNINNFKLVCGDFLEQELPSFEYKVFSNPPFNLTSTIVKKLLLGGNPPQDSYLFMQLEAAKKFAGQPLDSINSQLASIFASQFELEIIHNFKSSDFYPKPAVDVVILRIKAREVELITENELNKYRDFVAFAYNQTKPSLFEGLSSVLDKQKLSNWFDKHKIPTNSRPSSLAGEEWVALFKFAVSNISARDWQKIEGKFGKQQLAEQKMSKIYRTRVDPNWKQKK